ncbi:MAG TPA: prolyl oligopeptidase family serine peptidase [Salinimicrobium sp.]|nr:prolyl oligopeptidase family serine peptidase [Salinimicrobium sp.]
MSFLNTCKSGILFLLILFGPNLLKAQEKELFKPAHFIHQGDTLNYRILFPKDFSEEKEYPLVLFLHGAGERGDDNESQLIHGSKPFLKNYKSGEHPAIVVIPQIPKDDFWVHADWVRENGTSEFIFNYEEKPTPSMGLTIALIDSLVLKDFVEEDQVYVTGLSMGGMGTFDILSRRPETFAAAIPICGGGIPEEAEKYAENTAIWIFHGAKDKTVDPQHSINMAESIKKAGGNPKLTIYPNATHNSWDPAFAEPDLLDWLFSQKKD